MQDRSSRHSFALLIIWITLACSFSVGMLFFRMVASGSTSFRFLVWNLILAAVPVLFSSLAFFVSRSRWKWMGALFLIPWLLFFPNAPYILTDLLHLKERAPIPMWYDLLMLLSFALNGLFLGFLSLGMVEAVFERLFGRTAALIGVFACAFCAAFGIYLGRFERWNSWDLWRRPSGVLSDILPALYHPLSHARIWLITVLLGLLILTGYRMARGMGMLSAEQGDRNADPATPARPISR